GPIIIALFLGAAHQFGIGRRAYPLPGLLGPSDSLRSITAAIQTDYRLRPDRGETPVLVLARPPVSFYLNSKGSWRIVAMPDWKSLNEESLSREAAILVDEV